jgi:hypothetical protein
MSSSRKNGVRNCCAMTPAFVTGFSYRAAGPTSRPSPLVERMPEFVAFFGSRDGAAALAHAVLLTDIDGLPVPSRAEVAKLCGFSKSQITRVLKDGEARGYFVVDSAGAPAPTPRLRASYSKWVSIELAFYTVHMRSS